MNNINDMFIKLYEKTIKATTEISNPYEKATIYASVLNALSRVIASSVDTEVTVNNTVEAEEVVSNETEATEEVTEDNVNAADNNIAESSAIDTVSEEDDDSWTDKMLAKYANRIDFVNQTIEVYGEEEITKWLSEVTNGLYNSFAEMDPQTYLSTAELLQSCVA